MPVSLWWCAGCSELPGCSFVTAGVVLYSFYSDEANRYYLHFID